MSEVVNAERGEFAPAGSAPAAANLRPGTRVDAAHYPTAGAVAPLADSTPLELLPVESAVLASQSASLQRQEQMLLQAGQIAHELKQQYNDLDRREHRLHAQLALLEQERRSVRLWIEQSESIVQDREAAVAERELECEQRVASCSQLERELHELHQSLLRERHLQEGVREQLATESRRQAEDLACERQTHNEDLARELATHTQTMADERSAHDQTLALEREAHDRALQFERGVHERDIACERTTHEQNLERERAAHATEMQRERAELAAERERLQAEFRQERVLLENRLKFQQDHLQRARQDFETAQTAQRLEQQRGQTRLEETQMQLIRRRQQFERVRNLLDQRGDSLDRERTELNRACGTHEEQVKSDRERLRLERESWEQDREVQQADLRRQQDMLALHAENLETRRARLDRLRSELEETNRKTLEMRVAVEEAFAQLVQSRAGDLARQRVDEARTLLAEHYRHNRDAVQQQLRELEQAQVRLNEQREEFRQERQALVEWITQRETQIRSREQNLQRDKDAVDTHEQAWRTARERWTREKLDAEAVIRNLLRQLDEQNAA